MCMDENNAYIHTDTVHVVIAIIVHYLWLTHTKTLHMRIFNASIWLRLQWHLLNFPSLFQISSHFYVKFSKQFFLINFNFYNMRKLFFNQLLQSLLLPQPVFLMHYTQLIFDGYFPTSNNANRMTGNILEWRHMCVHMCDCAILPVYFKTCVKILGSKQKHKDFAI